MATDVGADPPGIGRIGRHWGLLLVFGVITVALGICAAVWPGITLLAPAIVFDGQRVSVWLIMFGLLEISPGFRLRSAGRAALG